jgi:hypothetical protein
MSTLCECCPGMPGGSSVDTADVLTIPACWMSLRFKIRRLVRDVDWHDRFSNTISRETGSRGPYHGVISSKPRCSAWAGCRSGGCSRGSMRRNFQLESGLAGSSAEKYL